VYKKIFYGFGNKSITYTLAFVFISLGLAIVFVASGFELYFIIGAEQLSVSEKQELVAKQAANTAKGFIESRFNNLESISKFHGVEDKDIKHLKDNAVLEKALGLEPVFRQLALFDHRGQELLWVGRFSRGASIVVVNKFIADNFDKIDLNQRYISPVYIDKITSEPMAIISVPIRDVFGDFHGILVAEVNLKFMWDLVGNIKVGKKGLVYVVDEKGDLIAFGDTSRVLSGENLSHLKEVEEFKDKIVEENKATITKGINNSYVVSSYEALVMPNWAVITEIPFSEAYSSVITIILLSVGVMLATITLVFLVSVRLSRSITKPILDLKNVANEISKGRFDIKAEITSENEIGQLASVFNLMTDNLQQKIRQLDEGQARLLASINSLAMGFILADNTNKIILQNSAVKKILGTTTDIRTMQDIVDLLPSDIDLMDHCRVCQVEKKSVEIKEVQFGKKVLRLFFAPVLMLYDHAEEIGYIFLMEDITEAKILERSKEEFFSIASHELRTPLTAIRGNASLLQEFYADKIKDKEAMDMIDDMAKASRRLIAIVNDFLDVSRLEQQRIKFKKEPFDISELINEVIKQLNGLASKKGLTVKFNGQPFVIKADRERIRQVLVNLVSNSIHYTKNGGITINLEKSDKMVKVYVKDTGSGIPLDKQSLLFHKFQQAGDMLARDVTQGTGLGLYISKLIMDTMGGTIKLEESAAGKGSTFSFSLPIEKV